MLMWPARVVTADATYEPAHVRARWQITNPQGVRWLAEVIDHCGCGSTRITAANPEELAW